MTLRFEPIPPVLPRQRLWEANSADYSFLISEEQDPIMVRGFMACWKNMRADMRPFGKQPANMIEGGPWSRFADAELACNRTLAQLKRRH